MNKKELILELMKSPIIREMVASRQFKLSDIKSVIAEQVLLEADESIEDMKARLVKLKADREKVKSDLKAAKVQKSEEEIEEIKDKLASLRRMVGALERNIDNIEKAEKEQQKSDQSSSQTDAAPTPDSPIQALDQGAAALGNELEKLGQAVGDKTGNREGFQSSLIGARKKARQAVSNVKNAVKAAKKTTPKTDDQVAATVVNKGAEMLKAASSEIDKMRANFANSGNTSVSELVHVVADEVEQLAIEIEDGTEEVVQAVKTAEQEDAKQGSASDQQDDGNNAGTKTGRDTETTTLVAPGWDNAVKSIRAKLQGKGFDEIKASLNNLESFKKFFGVRGSEASQKAKFDQAKQIMTDDWILGELQKIKQKFEKAQGEEAKQQAIAAAGNLATFLTAADMTLDKMNIDGAQVDKLRKLFKNMNLPKSEEEFKQEFLAPLKKASGPQALTKEQYVQVGNEVIKQNPNLFNKQDLEIREMREFIGWYVAGRISQTLNEGDGTTGALDDLELQYSQRLTKYEGSGARKIRRHILKNQQRWNKIFQEIEAFLNKKNQKTPNLVNIPKVAPSPDGDTKDISQKDVKVASSGDGDTTTEPDTEQDAEQDANADFEDVSTMDPVEFAEAQKEQLETFFGKNPKKASFMRKFLLRDQAKLLYDTMGALEGIANLDGEKLALTRNRPEKVTKPEEPTEDPKGDETKQNLEEQDTSNVEMDDTAGDEPNEQVADTNNQAEPKQKKIKIDKRFRQYVKSDLQAMVDVMRDVRKLVVQYEKNATRSSVDPRYDGSRLKKKLTQLLEEVQEDIADMVQTMHKAYPPLEMTFVDNNDELATEGIILEDDGDAERKAKIDFVEEVYNNAKREYLGQLRVSLNSGDFAEAQAGAKNVYQILNNEKFLSMFPTNVIRGGKVMTLKKATEAMSDVIQEFIEIVRDIVLLAKGEYVSPENIGRAKRKLRDISKDIEDMFKVPSQIDPKIKREIDKDTASKPDEKPFTNNPAPEPEVRKRYEINSEQEAAEWFNTLTSGQQEVLEKLYNAMKEEGVISERQESFWDELNTGAHLKTNRRTLVKALGKLEQKDRKILNFLIKNDKDNLIRFIGFIKGDSDLAQEIFSNKSQEPDGVAQLSLDSDDVIPSQSRVGDEVATNTGAEQGDSVMGRDEATRQILVNMSWKEDQIPDIVVEFLKNIADEVQSFYEGGGTMQEGVFDSAKRMAKSFMVSEKRFVKKFGEHSSVVEAALKGVDFKQMLEAIDEKELVHMVGSFISDIEPPREIAEKCARVIVDNEERRYQLTDGLPPANPMSTKDAKKLIRNKLRKDYDRIASDVYGTGTSEKIFYHFTQLIEDRGPGKLTFNEIATDLQEFLNKKENEDIAKKALEIQEAQKEFIKILKTVTNFPDGALENLDNYKKAIQSSSKTQEALKKLKELLPEKIHDKVLYSERASRGADINYDDSKGYILTITDSNKIIVKTMQEYKQNIEKRGKLVHGIPTVYYILTEFLKQNSEESSDTESTENGEEVSSDSTISANDDTSGNTSSTDSDPKPKKEGLEESLKPIIEKMLKEHYNY